LILLLLKKIFSKGEQMKIMTTFRIERSIHQKLKKLLSKKGMTLQGFVMLAITKLMDEMLNES
jgi:predicted DNA-binding protein